MTAAHDHKEYDRLAAFYYARVKHHDTIQPGYARQWNALAAAILVRGGVLVVPPMEPEIHLDTFRDNLVDFPPHPAVLELGTESACHANIANAWLFGDITSIVTGYGLSGDGLWRQHTWGLREGVLIETTEFRLAYCGVPLTGVDAMRFAAANGDPDLLADD